MAKKDRKEEEKDKEEQEELLSLWPQTPTWNVLDYRHFPKHSVQMATRANDTKSPSCMCYISNCL